MKMIHFNKYFNIYYQNENLKHLYIAMERHKPMFIQLTI